MKVKVIQADIKMQISMDSTITYNSINVEMQAKVTVFFSLFFLREVVGVMKSHIYVEFSPLKTDW